MVTLTSWSYGAVIQTIAERWKRYNAAPLLRCLSTATPYCGIPNPSSYPPGFSIKAECAWLKLGALP
jgi:hypothetical protein